MLGREHPDTLTSVGNLGLGPTLIALIRAAAAKIGTPHMAYSDLSIGYL